MMIFEVSNYVIYKVENKKITSRVHPPLPLLELSMEQSDVAAERSRLLNRQKKDRTELEKDVKKKKGALKQLAQEQLDLLEKAQAEELAEFDSTHGGKTTSPNPVVAAPQIVTSPAAPNRFPINVDWNDLSKKELGEECALRGLSKGGSKEEMVTRLIGWAAEMKAKGFEEPDSDDSSDIDDGSSVSSEDIPDMSDDQRLEAERQYKRELIVRKAILHLFETKFPDGFPLDQLPDHLAKIKVVNFKPESLGYLTLHDFARKQPRDVIFYQKDHKWLRPVKDSRKK
jgi:hypothetical protein